MMTGRTTRSDAPTKIDMPREKPAGEGKKLPNLFRRGANLLLDAPVSAAMLYSVGHATLAEKSPFFSQNLCYSADKLNQSLSTFLLSAGEKAGGHINVPDSETAAWAVFSVGAFSALYGVAHEAAETLKHRPLTAFDNVCNGLAGLRQLAATAFAANFIMELSSSAEMHQAFTELASSGSLQEALPHLARTGGIFASVFAASLLAQIVLKTSTKMDPDFSGEGEQAPQESRLLQTVKEPEEIKTRPLHPAVPRRQVRIPELTQTRREFVHSFDDVEIEIGEPEQPDDAPESAPGQAEQAATGQVKGGNAESTSPGPEGPAQTEGPAPAEEQEEGESRGVTEAEEPVEKVHAAEPPEGPEPEEDPLEDISEYVEEEDDGPEVIFGGRRKPPAAPPLPEARESGVPVTDDDIVEEARPLPPVIESRLKKDPFDFDLS